MAAPSSVSEETDSAQGSDSDHIGAVAPDSTRKPILEVLCPRSVRWVGTSQASGNSRLFELGADGRSP